MLQELRIEQSYSRALYHAMTDICEPNPCFSCHPFIVMLTATVTKPVYTKHGYPNSQPKKYVYLQFLTFFPQTPQYNIQIMNLNPLTRFTATVPNYIKYRPNYPLELFNVLKTKYSSTSALNIVEFGAGTGIFTRQLHDNLQCKIIAIEPNDAMRKAGEEENGSRNVQFMKAPAENTGLTKGSSQGVVAAQAFHWFELDKVVPEINRICVPGSFCAAIWNDRTDEGINIDIERLLHQFSSSYPSMRRIEDTIIDLKARIPSGEEMSFKHQQVMDLDGFIGRLLSASYITHGVDDKEKFVQALKTTFDNHQKDGLVTSHYRCRMFHWLSQ
jgi:ubiquinone/menaquinone biosynthesis C-methylase UbiE